MDSAGKLPADFLFIQGQIGTSSNKALNFIGNYY